MNAEVFYDQIQDFLRNDAILQMRRYVQHRDLDLLEHTLHVTYVSAKFAHGLKIEVKSIIKGAMLHDFFLYDWHAGRQSGKMHGFAHPKIAYENASKHFEVNPIEKDIILKHMWPLTLKPPVHKESLLVCLVDKYCSAIEMVSPRRRKAVKKLTETLLKLHKKNLKAQ